MEIITYMKYDGIILDVDGTIWNTTPLTAAAWNRAIAFCNASVAPVSDVILQTQFGKTMDVIATNLFGDKVTGCKRDELLKKCYEEEHRALQENTRNIMYDGVFDTVAELSKQVGMYVVSNCQKGYIELMLGKTKMTDFISDIECYGNTGCGKASNISLLVKRNGIKKPLYVGDTQGDCDECKKAGVPFVWAMYGFGKNVSGEMKIHSFSEIKKIVM